MDTENNIRGEALACIVEAHWRAIGHGQALRNIGKRQVTRVCYDGKSYIVKSYRISWFKRLFGMKMRSFQCLDSLKGLTPRCLNNYIDGNWQLVIFEDAGKFNLFELDFDKADDAATLGYFTEAGKLLAELHERNVYHGDTKTPNFVVNENCPDLSPVVIVDCDCVHHLDGELPSMKKAFNVAQFLESARARRPLDSVVSHFNAFCNGYRQRAALDDEAWKSLFSFAMEIAENNKRIERITSLDAIRKLRELQGV